MGDVPRLDPKELKKAYDEGVGEGLNQGRKEIFDWLEHKYLEAEDRPDRSSPEAEAILELTREARQHFMPRTKDSNS